MYNIIKTSGFGNSGYEEHDKAALLFGISNNVAKSLYDFGMKFNFENFKFEGYLLLNKIKIKFFIDNHMSENVNWLHVEAENKEQFLKFKSFLNKKSISLENVTKEIFNQFLTESNFPKFLFIPENFNFNDNNINTTFRGIHSFNQLTIKK